MIICDICQSLDGRKTECLKLILVPNGQYNDAKLPGSELAADLYAHCRDNVKEDMTRMLKPPPKHTEALSDV